MIKIIIKNENKFLFGMLMGGSIFSLISLSIIYYFIPPFPKGAEGFNVSGHPVFYMISEAFTAFFLFIITFLSSVLYLWKKNLIYDAIAVSSAKTGILASFLTLSIGILWSKVEWGDYWYWEPRQAMTLIMFIFYVGMILFRSTVEDIQDKAKLTAVFGIAAFPTVPMTNFVVGQWNLHPLPQQTVMSGNTFLAVVLLFVGTMFFYLTFLYLTTKLEKMQQKIDQYKFYILAENQ